MADRSALILASGRRAFPRYTRPMKLASKPQNACRVCGFRLLKTYLNLGMTPLANSYLAKNELEDGAEALRARSRVRQEPVVERIVVERSRQRGGERRDVTRCGTAHQGGPAGAFDLAHVSSI